MAIVSLMIRRAASHTVVPRAVRAVASSPGIILSNHGFINAGEHKKFSTVSAPNSDSMKIVDKKLNKVLRSEIKAAEQLPLEKRVMPPTPANFPFTIEDKPGENSFTLKREIGNEKIEIEVDMPCICQLPKEEPENPEEISSSTDDSSDSDDDDDEVADEKESDVSKSDDDACKRHFGLTIKVSKEDGKTLKFSVRAYKDWNYIDTITVDEAKSAESEEDEEDNEQPPASESGDKEEEEDKFIRPLFMEDLSYEVQNALRKFLEIRGLKEIGFGFLQNYAIGKHKSDRMLMLKKVRKFIKE